MDYFDALLADIHELMKGEDIRDPFQRLAVVNSQLGDVAKYLYHDPQYNPRAREHGTKEDEIASYGHLLMAVLAMAEARGLRNDLRRGLDNAVANWKDHDYAKRDPMGGADYLKGVAATQFETHSYAFVDPKGKNLERLQENPGRVLVVKHFLAEYVLHANHISGIVADDGGIGCHAAIIAREFHLPCIVGTGNATERIKDAQRIILEVDKDDPTVGYVRLF